ncbi:MAG: MBL fold metallo-hydrolase [Desulfatiglandales bacterium]
MKIFEDLYAFLWADPTTNNCNTYFINGSKKILVDPGHAHLFNHVREGLAALSLTPSDMDIVLITHAHPDHMEGVNVFADTPALVALHHSETESARQATSHYDQHLGATRLEPDILLREGNIQIGDMDFRVIHAPGHSPGSIALYWSEKKVLFSGDVIFSRGIGRTDLPGGNGNALKDSIKALSQLDVEILLPGHGDMVLGREQVKANFNEIERVWFAYL